MLAYDVRGRGSLLVLIQGVGVAAGVGSGWSTAGPPVSGHHHRQPRHRRLRRPARTLLGPRDGPGRPGRPDHAGIQRASVVGTSLGGMIAQELTLAHAEWVDKLVLVGTIPGWTAQPPYAAPPPTCSSGRRSWLARPGGSSSSTRPSARNPAPPAQITERLAARSSPIPNRSRVSWRATGGGGATPWVIEGEACRWSRLRVTVNSVSIRPEPGAPR